MILKGRPVSLVLFYLLTLLPSVEAAKTPNIVILYADDLGYGDLGCYNAQSRIPTPHLDRLAGEGMRFTDGHSSSGICTPSRYALLTGRHHWRDFHGIVQAMGASVFKPERLTLPEMLQKKGYRTAAIGKWHLGWDWTAIRKPDAKPMVKPVARGRRKSQTYDHHAYDWSQPIPDGPLAHGFDYYFGDTVINFPPYAWIENDRLVKAPDTMMDTSKWKTIKEGHWECRPGPMCGDWDPYQNIPTTTQKGVDYIKAQAQSDQPFFLYFAYPSPHAPIIPNDKFDGQSQAGPYGDLVVETDDSIGQLLAALKESGQEDNTIVIFSADNGPEYYAYARDEKYGHWSAKPLRGLKRDIYEGGHRVPFLIKFPGVTKAGSTCTSLVSQIDIMATLASVVEFDLPDKHAAEDSHDLLPVLTGAAASARQTHVHNTFKGQYAIRHRDWLLVATESGYARGRRHDGWEKNHGYAADDGQPAELYHLKNDVGQHDDIASKHPEKVKELHVLLEKIRKQGHSAPRLSQATDKPVTQNPKPIAPDQTITYKVDPQFPKQPLTLDVFYPEDLKAGEKRPAIVFFFGGGWVSGTPSQFYPHAAYLASRGMVAISARYRTKSAYRTPPSICVEDGKSAVRYIKQHAAELGVDAARIAVGGGSAGGHVAAATATVRGFDSQQDDLSISPVGNALVLFNPVYDNGPKGYGHKKVKAYWKKISPLHNLDGKQPPTIVFLGAKDDLVPVKTAELYEQKMKKNGNRCETFIYPGQEHGFFNLGKNRAHFVKTVTEMDKFLVSLKFLNGEPTVESWLSGVGK